MSIYYLNFRNNLHHRLQIELMIAFNLKIFFKSIRSLAILYGNVLETIGNFKSR